MTINEIMAVIASNKRGSIRSVDFKKELKAPKTNINKYEKFTTMQARLGVTYDNMAIVKDMRESGELPSENAGLPWGFWIMYPYLIGNKDKTYLRIATANGNKTIQKFFKNGIETSKDIAKAETLASNWNNSDKPITVLTIDIENIIAIR